MPLVYRELYDGWPFVPSAPSPTSIGVLPPCEPPPPTPPPVSFLNFAVAASTTPFQPVCASTISQTLRVLPLPSSGLLDVPELPLELPHAAAPSSVAVIAAATAILRFTHSSSNELPGLGEVRVGWVEAPRRVHGAVSTGRTVDVCRSSARSVLGGAVRVHGTGGHLEGRVRLVVQALGDGDVEQVQDDQLGMAGRKRVRPERRALYRGQQDQVGEL